MRAHVAAVQCPATYAEVAALYAKGDGKDAFESTSLVAIDADVATARAVDESLFAPCGLGA